MKRCTYCGNNYPDNHTVCAADGHPLPNPPPPIPSTTAPATGCSPEKISARQVAVIFIRLEAAFLVFSAIVECTYLPYYLLSLNFAAIPFLLLRLGLYSGGAIILFIQCDKILNWLARATSPAQAPAGQTGA